MTSLTRISLANRIIIGLITIAIIVFGVLATRSLKQELLPSTQIPTAVVTATYPGATPQIVAKDVSAPMETAISGISGVTDVSSVSTNGAANITVQWEYGKDDDKVVSDIRSAVDGVPDLPSDVETKVFRGSTDDIPVVVLAVSTDLPLDQSGELVKNVATPALTAIDGVRQVDVAGQDTTQLTVTLRPKDLKKHDITAQAVTQTVQSQLTVMPAGTAYDKSLELAVQVGTDTDSVKQVKALAVPTSDGPIALSKVADVEIESIKSSIITRANGEPALSVTVLKESDGDAVAISHSVAAALPGIAQTIGHDAKFTTLFDQAPLIEQSIHDLTVEGGLGLVFAVLVILLFLWSVRSTLITAISIPLSLLVALIGLQVGGYSLNIFTLAALTVAVGRVVDDSIVVLENIKRRDTGHAALTPADIIASVKEVSGAVTASTATTIAVFLPVAVVSGVTGELFRPFAITVAVALIASLLVSMSVVPVLAYWFLRGGKRKKAAAAAAAAAGAAAHDPAAAQAAGPEPATGQLAMAAGPVPPAEGGAVPVPGHERVDLDTTSEHTSEETKVTRLQRGYLPVLGWALRHPVMTLALALVVFIGTMGASTLLKTDFIGSVTDQTVLTVKQELPAGTKQSTMSKAAQQVEAVLAKEPAIDYYLTMIGGSIYSYGGTGGNTAEYTVQLKKDQTATEVRPGLEQQLAALPPSAGDVTVTQAQNGSTSTDLTVTVKGENPDDVRKGSEQVEAALKGVPGLSDVTSNLADQRKLLQVTVDPDQAAALGFTQADVGQAVAGALRGSKVGEVTLSGDQREVWLKTQDAKNATPKNVKNLLLPVSQLQQSDATKRATDSLQAQSDDLADQQRALGDRQKAMGNEQQDKAVQATADQKQELRKQLKDAKKARADLQKDLKKARKQLSKAEDQLAAIKPPAQTGIVCPPPAGSPIWVACIEGAINQLGNGAQAQQYMAQLGAAQAAVAGANAGIKQLEAAIEQSDKGIDQLNESISKVSDQQVESAQSRAESDQLSNEQQALSDEQEALGKKQRKIADIRADAVRVKDVADVTEELAPTSVTQIEGNPSVTISATPTGDDLGALTKQVTTTLDGLQGQLPGGVTAELGGASADQQQAFKQLGLAMLVAIALVFMIMVGTFRSLAQPLILMVSIPFAATGAIAGLLITDTPLGVPAMVGLLMLIGIVVTNAIVLIDLINQYRNRGEDLKTAITDGARLRLRPIIMTACATIFALIPMGLGLTGGGAFISQPLAVVVIGGLISSTILTLLLVPVLYSLVERRSEKKRQKLQQAEAGPQPA